MKIDDPRLEKARKEMAERVEKYNALLLSVIKTHLVVEQAMDGLLAAALFHPEYIRETRFNFAHKMKICQAMALTDNEDKLWRVLGAFNSLRNKLAHTTQIDEIRSNMDQLRKVYLSSLNGKQVEALKEEPDHRLAEFAAYLCAGFLATLAEDSKSQRRVIDNHWKPTA